MVSSEKLLPILSIIVLFFVSAFFGVQLFYSNNNSSSQAVSFIEVTVKSGDTLWTIAKKSVPDQDPRKVVWVIQSENQLQQATIFPGQVLKVPNYQASL